MKRSPSFQSAFLHAGVLISFASCAIAGVVALITLAAYPVGNVHARQPQSSAQVTPIALGETAASGFGQVSAAEQAVDSSETAIAHNPPSTTDAAEPILDGGNTYVVNTTSDTQDVIIDEVCADHTGACSLRAAITEANFGGSTIIILPAGVYTQSLSAPDDDNNAGGDWDIRRDITINGAGSGTTFIQANAAPGVANERVLDVRVFITAVVNGVTIQNGRFSGAMGSVTRGAGIQNLGTLTLNNCVVRDNRINSTAGNSIGAGIYSTGPALTLTNTTVTANSNVTASGGSAFGGGVSSTGGAITITDSSISGNSATSQAGGFAFGAGLSLDGAFNVNATNSSFDNNTASGAIGSNGTGVRVLSNSGHAIFNATNCTFNGNSGTGGGENRGQGLQLFTTTTAAASCIAGFERVTVNGNSGNGPGVGIHAQANGGALEITARNSTISNNTGATNGGGINTTNVDSSRNSPLTINFTNSTISGNSAAAGGGLYVEQPTVGTVTANLNFVTVANNSASAGGGGLFVSTAGAINLKNSIVADNTAPSGPNLSGTITSQNYNHIENPSGASFAAMANDVVAGDPALGPLANNGGVTLTHFPRGGPAVNAIPNGINDCGLVIGRDQRGPTFDRPRGGACEKGSVEIQPLQVTGAVSRKTHGAAGTFDVDILNANFGPECRSSAGNHTLVFSFSNNVVSGSASITSGIGSVSGTPMFSGSSMIVNLTGVGDAQKITVSLSNVTDAAGQSLPSIAVSANMLIGDINGSKVVTASDIGAVKAQSGVPVTAANFRADAATSGAINASDIGLVKSRSGQSVP